MNISILDLDLKNLSSVVKQTITAINEEDYTLNYLESYQDIDLNGEAHLTTLGFSFMRVKSAAVLFSEDDDKFNEQYLNATEKIAHNCLTAINDLFDDIDNPGVKPVQIQNIRDEHITWTTDDNDRLTFDLADDSLSITLYLSGQY